LTALLATVLTACVAPPVLDDVSVTQSPAQSVTPRMEGLALFCWRVLVGTRLLVS